MAFTKIAAAGIGSTGTVTLEHVVVTGSVETPVITGAASTANVRANSLVVSGVSTLGSVVATTGTFSGNVSIAGTLTYEDVTNIDSVGLITARSGIRVTDGGVVLVGSATSTGTASQPLQVTGGAYISGNLGIGTTRSIANLQVNNTLLISGNDSGDGSTPIEIISGSASGLGRTTGAHIIRTAGGLGKTLNLEAVYTGFGTGGGRINFLTNDTVRVAISSLGTVLIGGSIASQNVIGSASSTTLLQVTGDAYVSGNLGVGATNPSYKLDVQGGQNVTTQISLWGKTIGQPQTLIEPGRIYATAAGLGAGDLLLQPTGGNLGIGTVSSAVRMHLHTPGNDLSVFRLSGTAANAVTYDLRQGIIGVSNGGFSIRDINNSVDRIVIAATGQIGIGTNNPSQALDVNGYVRANRFTVPYGQVVSTYKTNNPSTNVVIEGTPNDRDFWIFRDPADSNTNWGMYYRNIDSTLSESGEYSVPANSVSFVGGGTASPGVTIDLANGDLQVKRNIKIGNNNIIQWVELTPGVTEWSWNAQVTSQAITLNPSTIPSTARYVLADVFVTASTSDHQNVVLGRDALTNQKNWVDTRGQQPSGQFGTLTRQAVTLTYNGEADGYTPNFGMWYASQHIPCSGRTIYYNNYGWSGSSGWVYVVVKAYSL